MFDIGFPELMIVAIVALLVLGPERLPEVLRTAGLWMGRLRRSFGAVKAEIEQEIGMDDIRRQLHNEAILDEMKRIEADVQNSIKPDTPDQDTNETGENVTDKNVTGDDAAASDTSDSNEAPGTESPTETSRVEPSAEQKSANVRSDES